MNEEFKKVTKEEFDNFLKNYPNKLEKYVSFMFEPPLMTYNDYIKNKKWPDSVIAWICLEEEMKGHPAYDGKKIVII